MALREPFFGVKVEHLKKIQKRIKTNYQLALDLYDTGNSDAMYLAGLIADDASMTKKDLERWVKGAYWYMLSEYTVPWVAAGSPHGHDLALKWIEARDEKVAAAGWATLGCLVGIKEDAELDLAELKKLLQRVAQDHPRAAQPRPLHDERFRHLRRLLRAAADRPGHRNRQQDRQGGRQHGRHAVQGSCSPPITSRRCRIAAPSARNAVGQVLTRRLRRSR